MKIKEDYYSIYIAFTDNFSFYSTRFIFRYSVLIFINSSSSLLTNKGMNN